ncbi:MAG: glycosyltransferase family 39 protein [Chloroflexi bacterium]|nr:glycosyltransferase family 39 protein [Chloroflexota bacterium]
MTLLQRWRARLGALTERQWLAAVVLVAVMARIVFLVVFGHTLSLETSGYDAYAVNLMEDGEYTRFDDRDADSDLPPLYALFLVGVYATLGRDPVAVALVQTGLDVLTMLLLFWIGRRVVDATTGLLATALYGLYPYLLFQNLTLNDTALFITLLAASIACAYAALDAINENSRRAWGFAVLLGLAMGLGALTKTLIVLVLPLLALWWWRHVGFRRAFLLGLVSGLALLAVIAPWVVRNMRLHDEFVLISTNGGSNLHQGNNAYAADFLSKGWDVQWVDKDRFEMPPDDLDEVEAGRWHQERAGEYLREHPGEWPRLVAVKLWVLWNPQIMPHDVPPNAELVGGDEDPVLQYNSSTFQLARVVHVLYFAPLLALGIAGWVTAWREGRLIGPLLAVMLAITLTYVVFHPSTRYRSPADPFVFVLSAHAGIWLLKQGYARWTRNRSTVTT